MPYLNRTWVIALSIVLIMALVAGALTSVSPKWTHITNEPVEVISVDPDQNGAYLTNLPSPLSSRKAEKVNRGLFGLLGPQAIPVPQVSESPNRGTERQLYHLSIKGMLGQTPSKVDAVTDEITLDGETLKLKAFRTPDGRLIMSKALLGGGSAVKSPSDSRIAISDSRGTGLWIYDLETRALREVLQAPQSFGAWPKGVPFQAVGNFIWSKDQGSIYFGSNRNSPFGASIWRISVGDSTSNLAMDANKYGPLRIVGLGPTGQIVVSGGETVWLVTNGEQPKEILTNIVIRSISKDGPYLAYSTSQLNDLWIINLITLEKHQVSAPMGYVYTGANPAWSNSNRFAVMFVNPNDPEDGILTIGFVDSGSVAVKNYGPPLESLRYVPTSQMDWMGDALIVGLMKKSGTKNSRGTNLQTWVLDSNQ